MFNQNINNWDVSKVTSMKAMFRGGDFNSPLDKWNVSNVRNMDSMFENNRVFDQNIKKWDVKNVSSHTNFNKNCPLRDEYNPFIKAPSSSIYTGTDGFPVIPTMGWDSAQEILGDTESEIYKDGYINPLFDATLSVRKGVELDLFVGWLDAFRIVWNVDSKIDDLELTYRWLICNVGDSMIGHKNDESMRNITFTGITGDALPSPGTIPSGVNPNVFGFSLNTVTKTTVYRKALNYNFSGQLSNFGIRIVGNYWVFSQGGEDLFFCHSNVFKGNTGKIAVHFKNNLSEIVGVFLFGARVDYAVLYPNEYNITNKLTGKVYNTSEEYNTRAENISYIGTKNLNEKAYKIVNNRLSELSALSTNSCGLPPCKRLVWNTPFYNNNQATFNDYSDKYVMKPLRYTDGGSLSHGNSASFNSIRTNAEYSNVYIYITTSS